MGLVKKTPADKAPGGEGSGEVASDDLATVLQRAVAAEIERQQQNKPVSGGGSDRGAHI